MAQVLIWRRQAARRLEELVMAIQEPECCASDQVIDDLIRAMSQLPPRPNDRQPYEGVFAVTDVQVGRQKALARLQELIAKIAGDACGPDDALVDDLLRSLSQLPARPTDKQPYASLFPESQFIACTSQDLLAIASFADASRVSALASHLNQTMIEFDITTPLRQAHFIAQLAHESGSFNYLEEIADGSDYEDRSDLGNTQPGDGVRFKGRGLIQITGRTNYLDCGKALGVDLISNPQRLAEPDLACRSAGWYWGTRSLNDYADKDDIDTITYLINGGYNGFDERKHFLQVAKQVLKV